jgi:hypothetical protein
MLNTTHPSSTVLLPITYTTAPLSTSTSSANPTLSQFTSATTNQDPPTLTIIFGVFGVILAFIGLTIAALQLLNMYRRRRTLTLKMEEVDVV